VQLRRLEFVGFKTFVDRTALEFHPGITAIVGPNGSGKSNIFDGIRWVLGETNARMLRGARMEDVIFSGSATRKPTGMASVVLTFDNSSGLLPIEFSEVSVGRRVTRGGQGEYVINGVDCRLRDVQMLFLGTGLGGRSYALIGQGEVDAVLRATPVERRHWLEEAAGLARHKRQRIEAERRLDHARAHLDRLTDLADELAHRREALAAQAEAAVQHQAYTRELRELEVALFADEARRLLAAVRRLSVQLAAERAQAAAAASRVSEAAADAALVEAQLATVSSAWEQGQQALLAGAETLGLRASEVQALDAQAEGLRGRLAQLDADLARLAEEREALADTYAALTRDADEAEQRRADLEQDVAALEAALAAAEAAVEEARSALARGRDDAVEVARAFAQGRSDLAALRARADMMAQSVDTAARRVGTLTHEAAALAADRQRLQQTCEDARQAMEAADERIAATASALDDVRRQAAADADAVHAAELHEHRLLVRLHSLEEAAAQFIGFEESTREVLKAAAAEPSLFPGLRGTVADLLKVPEAHQPAITAALGDRLHCLVVDDPDQLEHIVGFFKAHASRHGTALAVAALRSGRRGVDVGLANGDVVAYAPAVVEADGPASAVVDALLGDVVIVADLPAAWRVFADGYPGRIVTADGTLVGPEGVVTVAGRPQGDVAPLGRPHAIAELRAAADDAQAKRWQAEERRAEAGRQVAAAEGASAAAQAERAAAAATLAERLQHLARIDAEVARIGDEEIEYTAQVRRSTEDLHSMTAEIGAMEADLAALEAEAARQETQVVVLEEEMRRRGAARDAAAADAAARRLLLVQAEGVLGGIRVRLADRASALADAEARRVDLGEVAARAAADLAEVTTRRDEAQAAYEELLGAQADRKSRVERLAAERVQLRDDLAQRQADHAAASEAASAAEAALHRTELRAAQAEAELGAAAARLQEQYGITLEEAATRRLEGSREEARRRHEALREALDALGPVNLRAIDEHAAVAARLEALEGQTRDIGAAADALRQAIANINALLRVRFRETFEEVNAEFVRLFERLFTGGHGSLELVEDDLGAEPGLEVIAQLPGKRRRPLVALSGGERALVAITLIFAMLRVHPSPFCIFDEIEAALDDANTKRFTELLRDLAQTTQVLIITHNKGTMAAADILYGVTMQEPGLSCLVSVRLVPPSPNGDRAAAAHAAPAEIGEPGPSRVFREREVAALPAE
jgi:chromosome segregation protein